MPNCSECQSKYTYQDQEIYVCPECYYEWSIHNSTDHLIIRDINGNLLKDGDDVTVIKDLKVKGSSNVVKIGTKIKNIKLLDKPDHNIDCKVSGFGAMRVTALFVKKV